MKMYKIGLCFVLVMAGLVCFSPPAKADDVLNIINQAIKQYKSADYAGRRATLIMPPSWSGRKKAKR